jgi:toxin YoeB
MRVSFTRVGWNDLVYWIETDRRKVNRLVRLIRDTTRSPFEGIGEPR